MGQLFSKLGWAGAIAGVAVVVYAQRRAQKTGRDLGAVLANLPGELKETRAELEQDVKEAVEVGKKAAAKREAEFDRQISPVDSGIGPIPDFLV
jgi:Sec-independent protein translocase protein TatA